MKASRRGEVRFAAEVPSSEFTGTRAVVGHRGLPGSQVCETASGMGADGGR
jgi:hypothetical protein